MGLESLIFPLYELYWLLTTRHLTANIFSCIPIFLDNDFCKTINLFIIDIYACSIYLEEKAPIENQQTSINKNNHVKKNYFKFSFLNKMSRKQSRCQKGKQLQKQIFISHCNLKDADPLHSELCAGRAHLTAQPPDSAPHGLHFPPPSSCRLGPSPVPHLPLLYPQLFSAGSNLSYRPLSSQNPSHAR